MSDTKEYYRIAYKKYKAYCHLNVQEMRENEREVDFQMFSFEQFIKKVEEDPEFAKIWGYWNFV